MNFRPNIFVLLLSAYAEVTLTLDYSHLNFQLHMFTVLVMRFMQNKSTNLNTISFQF